MNYSWGHKRRFNAYSNYFKRIFGERVQKLSIDAGFTCPNRDGSLGQGGCTFCNNNAFNPSYCLPEKSITQQIEEGLSFHKNRYRRAGKYLVYFQAYSNTYSELEELKKKYEEALAFSDVVGLVIGTRPDVIDEQKLEYFSSLSEQHYIIIEYGVESVYDKTLQRINRGHDFETSVKAIELTKSFGLKCGAHFIMGLPGESRVEIRDSGSVISQLPLDTVKFHQLQILKGTVMAEEYKSNPDDFDLFELEEYVDFISEYITYLNPSFVIERFAGEVPPRYNAGPSWGLIRNDQILNMIERKLEEKDLWQGKNYKF